MTNRSHPRCREINWQGQANCKVCTLRKGLLFARLPDEALDGLLSVERMVHGAKAVLYQEGEPALHLYSVREGLVKLVQRAPNGSSRIVRLLKSGDVAGLESLSDGRYRHTAEAILPTHLCRIAAEGLSAIRHRYSELSDELMQRWQQSLDRADEVITQLSTGTAQGRVARVLLYTLSEPGSNRCVALTRDDLAALLSLTVETVSRTVAEFKRQGIVNEEHGVFHFDRLGLGRAATL
ncbi:MAG: Crp/Fnr family transcriptional regulator [Rhodocyclaceae bacterium]|nr:Crp/Fnr family transcriptional regulator [Rhodocyclaceae bacterium]